LAYNLRTLKKLSKRAAPLLPLLGDTREQFRAKKHENFTSSRIPAQKHWERGRSVHSDCIGDGEIKKPAADGNGWVYQRPPSHPLKGTVIVGSVSGYYEPEWDEETAWDALEKIVHFSFMEHRDDEMFPTRAMRTPSQIFRGARDLIAGR
jgi:hypothetical protein